MTVTDQTPTSAAGNPIGFGRMLRKEDARFVRGQGIAPEMAAAWDAAVCRHVADAVEQVDALVKRAGRN